MDCIKQYSGEKYSIYNGDSCQLVKDLPDNSIGYSIFSPPFASLYTYSDFDEDMGNSRNDEEFFQHFGYLVRELLRITQPGRNVSVHCMDMPIMKERDGYIGVKDFPGDIIRLFINNGFILHSKVLIWKDPLIEATRTKALGLMHKQLCKDSAMCRQGLPDYLLTFRKPGENQNPIRHPEGLTSYAGSGDIGYPVSDIKYSHNVWRKYASPVWMDIRQTNTLNKLADKGQDERHICPLQLDVIERGLTLWSNPEDIVFTPFMGIGSEVYQAVKMGRHGIGFELKPEYFEQAYINIQTVGAENHTEIEIKPGKYQQILF